mmetsp:Transcript_36928/g.77133  ORF Transcript_36928/g.77133 Transcript_36928/m.77133 type:complete len:94 (-) Transcript_36928:175-456(-)
MRFRLGTPDGLLSFRSSCCTSSSWQSTAIALEWPKMLSLKHARSWIRRLQLNRLGAKRWTFEIGNAPVSTTLAHVAVLAAHCKVCALQSDRKS